MSTDPATAPDTDRAPLVAMPLADAFEPVPVVLSLVTNAKQCTGRLPSAIEAGEAIEQRGPVLQKTSPGLVPRLPHCGGFSAGLLDGRLWQEFRVPRIMASPFL
jgi:hypothetical protein